MNSTTSKKLGRADNDEGVLSRPVSGSSKGEVDAH